MDIYSVEERSEIMRHIRSRNTMAERRVRGALHRLGYRFRLNVKSLPGKPDVVLPRHRRVVLVHGCFWHQHAGCPRSKPPATRTEWWTRKLTSNADRDERVRKSLEHQGWSVLVIWECETKKSEGLNRVLARFMTESLPA